MFSINNTLYAYYIIKQVCFDIDFNECQILIEFGDDEIQRKCSIVINYPAKNDNNITNDNLIKFVEQELNNYKI